MVIDSSVFLAIAYREEETVQFVEAISADTHCLTSAATVLEVGINLINRSETMMQDFEAFLSTANIRVVSVDEEQAQIAIEACRRFGRGRHPAKLNYGDCFAYALAKQSGEPLLFKGADFKRTDVDRVF